MLTDLPLFLQFLFFNSSLLYVFQPLSPVENGGTLNLRDDFIGVIFTNDTNEVHDGNVGDQGFEVSDANDARMNGRHSSSSGVDVPNNFDDDEGESEDSSKMRMKGLVRLGLLIFLFLFFSGIVGIVGYNKEVAAMKALAVSPTDSEDCPEDCPDARSPGKLSGSKSGRHLESWAWGGKNGEFKAKKTPMHQ